MDYADLEIGLRRRNATTFGVELRFALPNTDAENRLAEESHLQVTIDGAALSRLRDDEEYGLALGRGLLAGAVGQHFREFVAVSQSHGVRLRVRLTFAANAAALHGLRWESLRDPVDGATLLTKENILFSRYLASLDWRPVGVRPRGDLTALAVVAAPSDAGEYGTDRPLAPVDLDAEMGRARAGLTGLRLTEMPGVARPTATNLLEQVRVGYDVIYLVCHGYLHDDEPILLLEDDDGRAAPMLGSTLVDRLNELSRTPRLVYLASCQTAGAGPDRHSDDAGVLAALGPQLAESGVPAVVAMQGNISMATAGQFSETFFRNIHLDGLVDRATAVARASVRERPDWWVPALFMRLKSGRLWYNPGSATGGVFDKWPSLISHIEDRNCTPVIGPSISDALLGSRQEIARSWATSYRYPMSPHSRESLPQVAQYLSVNQKNRLFPRKELERHLRRTLLQKYRQDLPAELDADRASLEALLAAAWGELHRMGGTEPYSVLAELPAPLYVTTQPSHLLVNALVAAGRQPEIAVCHWHERSEWPESVFDREPGYRPTPDRPLVYHLLGLFSQPESLVLTEDDYFDFLIGVTRIEDAVPPLVRRMLTDSALMFVGFRLDDWDFRVLYRSLMNAEGRARLDDYTHVAVQIDPEEGTTMDAARARQYLADYFGKSNISLYWGSTDTFVKELHEQWRAPR